MACVLSLPPGLRLVLPLCSVRAKCAAGEGCPFLPGVLLSAHSLLQAGTVVWIGILVYTDPAGLFTYLAAQVAERSRWVEIALAPLPVPGGVLPAATRTLPFHLPARARLQVTRESDIARGAA